MAFTSRDSDKIIGGKKKGTGMKKHIHNKNLGSAVNEGVVVGQGMLRNHKGPARSMMATKDHDKSSMRKHRIEV